MKRKIKCFDLPSGRRILAGQTDADNEWLSLRGAHPNDHWFHVRGMPGSHVVLARGTAEGEPSRADLDAAAAAAAWYSKARNGGVTAVSCTLAKFVGKPRGAPTGTVTIRNEKTIKVRPALPPGVEPSDFTDEGGA